MSSTYGERLHKAARREWKTFWSGYRAFVTIVAILSPIIIQILRHGVRSVVNVDETLANGFIGLCVSLVGTYLIAIRKGAENLDVLRADELAGRDSKIQELTIKLQVPKRSDVDEHHFRMAQDALVC
jgi:hypothetical protein